MFQEAFTARGSCLFCWAVNADLIIQKIVITSRVGALDIEVWVVHSIDYIVARLLSDSRRIEAQRSAKPKCPHWGFSIRYPQVCNRVGLP